MKTLELMDHDLSVSDYSHFELKLQAKGGTCTADFRQWTTPQGTPHIELSHPVIEFDEAQSSEADIQALAKGYGFLPRSGQ